MAKSKRAGGKLRNLPHRELKEIAKTYGIPVAGTVEALRTRLDRALSGGVKDQLAGSFVQTKQAFSYRYYEIQSGSRSTGEVIKAVSRRESDADPFRTELRPQLNEIPQIYRARVAPGNVLFLHIAFSGDERTVQDGWKDVQIVPPILCVLAVREAEGIVELRGRWEKVSIVEAWVKESLLLNIELLRFDSKLLARLKKILKAKLANQTIRPNAGGIGTIRIASSAPNVDLDENESAAAVRMIYSKVGFQPSNQGFVFHPAEIRVRANDKEGSFYIPKHAREEEVNVLRHAFLVAHGLMEPNALQLPAPELELSRKQARSRLLTPDVLQERLGLLRNYTTTECKTIANVLKGLQRDQQERILPAIWELWLPGRDAGEVMTSLVRARVLKRRVEANCKSCDFVGDVPQFASPCPECGVEIVEGITVFRLRGYLEPESAEDQVFHPDYTVLANKYNRLRETRVGGSKASNHEKMKALEDLVEYLFVSLDGLQCTGRNVPTANHEVDRVFRNINQSHPLISKIGSPLRVECKNTAGAVSSADFGTFVDVLRDSKSSFGVYVSMDSFSGLSKDSKKPKKLSDAVLTARDARRDGIKVLMVTGKHLEAVCTEGRSMVAVLWGALEFVEGL